MTHPYLDHSGPIAFAHRGYSARHPENTLAAFEAAVDLGYSHIETDVHVSRDGRLLVFHDDRLERLTDRTGIVAELDWREIAKARVAGPKGGAGEPIPLFEELLRQFPDTCINIEPKSNAAVPLLAKALQEHDATARCCIGSFSSRRLARIRQLLGPSACTSHGPFDVVRLRLASWGLPMGRFPGDCLQIPVVQHGLRLIDPAFIHAAHRRSLKVHVWTINQRVEMERLIDLGVDGIISDEAALLKKVMRARGLWHD